MPRSKLSLLISPNGVLGKKHTGLSADRGVNCLKALFCFRYVYIVADPSDPTFVFQDVEESGNQISSIEMSGDCITFQVQTDESAA